MPLQKNKRSELENCPHSSVLSGFQLCSQIFTFRYPSLQELSPYQVEAGKENILIGMMVTVRMRIAGKMTCFRRFAKMADISLAPL